MTVIRSHPGRIRFSAQTPEAVQLLQQEAEAALDQIETHVAVKYNPRTKRGLLTFEKSSDLTNLLVDVIEGMAHQLASSTVSVDVQKTADEVAVDVQVTPPEDDVEHSVWIISKKVMNHYMGRMFMPPTLLPYWTAFNVAPLIWKGLNSLGQRKLDVNVLDAAAVGAAFAMRDYRTAGTINLLLDISATLEDWTKEKSRRDIAALFDGEKKPVWVLRDDEPVVVSSEELVVGDLVVVRSGARIPVDGVVADGLALVNQSSMTGEPFAVEKGVESEVYSGTVVEEGRIIVHANAVGSDTRFSKIAKILTESDERKAEIHCQAVKMADKIVPFSFVLAGLVYVATRNARQAAAVLLADYSCAVKLATPLAVRSAMLEAAHNGAVIKGGKYLESLSKLDAVVLDKTGTLTEARPEVVEICSFNGYTDQFVLQQAACMEEHFPHPVADAIVRKADEAGLVHSEDHAEVEYILAHGIVTTLDGQRTVLGSRHFVHEDEGISFDVAEDAIAECSGAGISLLYFACGDKLAGVIAIKDPLRGDAGRFIRNLEQMDVERIIMLTGDGEDTAASVAADLQLKEYYAQALPDEKTALLNTLRSQGYTVAMVGDGINDSAALTAADVGVSMKHGADIAREACDILLTGERLDSFTDAMEIAKRTMRRIRCNFMFIVASNTLLIGLGIVGVITPALMALLHNIGTVVTCVHSMRPMLPARTIA
ncbi:heavy metal translocating P-type ATPase [Halodesulfovibrio marinisediminis]|uniref:P-type Zn(2+) transporter n=1 Tax=Halodesulfovibrio marinisediminis DSM 17456 TaxID=1121457 RepID=A0A1N6FUS3_9BACT|nr:heavy metal translocating P-type ATPase [Halodesulfovibrio marinisediminis]SIN99003.1 ATPase, P-type (transporting), HAD superfamily, subfamily IC/heavy metal translocating P-type ATPase [Halodesulfovibrio marinisediminis DSM 17456]